MLYINTHFLCSSSILFAKHLRRTIMISTRDGLNFLLRWESGLYKHTLKTENETLLKKCSFVTCNPIKFIQLSCK